MKWQRGESGNPGGKPKQKEFTEALRYLIIKPTDGLPPKPTNLQQIAWKLIEKAKEGETAAIKEIADRLEGKADAGISVHHSGSIAPEREGIPETLGWLREISGKDQAGEAPKPVLN